MNILKFTMITLVVLLVVPSCLTGCGDLRNSLRGAQGNPGEAGSSGSTGQGCTSTAVAPSGIAPNGGVLIDCGPTSAIVLNGTPGANGVAGSPGTVISSIQLCPGIPVYPSKFIETALCLDNNLYGVYSANGGFLTLLPAGYYGSNGINSSCNFTVGPNCSVSN